MATLKDIAQEAGVSMATVSRVLNGGKGISDQTCQKIRTIAHELNYIPNLSAKILAGKSSKMIGIIVPEIDSNYFTRIISSVENRLQKHGYSLLIVNTQYKKEKEIQALNTFCTYNVDGIFLACTINNDILDDFVPVLKSKHIPLVLLEARLHNSDYSYIMIDDEAGMCDAVHYLKEKGYDRIGFIGDYILDILRSDQFLSALRANHMDPAENPIYSNPSHRFEQGGYETMQRILQDPRRPRAFLAGYDDIAIGAIRAIHEAGLRVPEDIAIVGNDNIREAAYLKESLTTLSPPVERMAGLGVDLMLQAVENMEEHIVHNISLKPDLIIRETA